ncbi:MAG: hypothetical protein BM556_09420 [Bacteriovorax sp. MedPE-SWde]|nr:MAG: hypothetical protein BM556_09420 [Bacteriovorax sp. MedPE-SWde]
MNLNQNSNRKKQMPIFDVEDFEIEDIPFRPLTDGLGFNDQYSDFKKPKTTMKSKRVQEKVYEQMSNVEVKKDVPMELEAFYNAPKHRSPQVNKELDLKVRVERSAPLLNRFLGWFIDTALCLSVFSIITGMMYISTSMSLKDFNSLIMTDYNFVFPFILLVLVYNIYGISMGFQQTIGQKLFKVKNNFDHVKTEAASFLIKRSYFELFSICTLGIPYLLNYDYKVLGNKVVKS